LTKAAASLVAADNLKGTDLRAGHIAKSFGQPAAVYIGGLVADGIFAKAELLARVGERLNHFQEKGIPVYTRPVTDDGFRVVQKYDFQPAVVGRTGLKHVYVKLGDNRSL